MSSTMLKKLLLLLPILILLTGCGSSYEIEFTQKDTIKDTISIYEDNEKVEKYTQKEEDKVFNNILEFERGYEHYKRELYSTEKITGYKYTYEFTYDEYDAMSQLRKCFEDMTLTVNKNTIELQTKGEFLCASYYPQMPYVDITIKSDYKVKESNADTNKNNVLTWRINKQNYKNSNIHVVLNKNLIIEDDEEEKELPIKNIIIILLFIVAIIFIIKNRKKYKK